MFRFSLRDLFWLTMVVALALGWWLDRHPPHTWVNPLPTWVQPRNPPRRNKNRDTSFNEPRQAASRSWHEVA